VIDERRMRFLKEIEQEFIERNITFKLIDEKKINADFNGDVDLLADWKHDDIITSTILHYCKREKLQHSVMHHVSLMLVLSKKFIIFDPNSSTLPLQIDTNYSFHWIFFEFFNSSVLLENRSSKNLKIKDTILFYKNIFYRKAKHPAECVEKMNMPFKRSRIIRFLFLIKFASKNLSFQPIFLINFFKNALSQLLINARESRSIAFYGSDGAGKTTIIDAVENNPIINAIFDEVVIRHTRPGILPSISALLKRKKKIPDVKREHRQYSFSKSHLVLLYYFADYFLERLNPLNFLRRKKTLILYDRYFLEYAYQPAFQRISPYLVLILEKIILRPNHNFYLSGDAKIISSRKNEITKHFVNEQYSLYQTYVSSISDVPSTFIDTTKLSKVQSLDRVITKILNNA